MTAGQNRIPVNLDYAASTPMRAEALLAQREYDDSELAGVNPNSLHSLGRKAAARLEVARREIARSFGAHVRPSEIVLTNGGTEANQLALLGLAEGARQRDRKRDRKRGRVIVSAIEHDSILDNLPLLRAAGFTVDLVQPCRAGYVEPATLVELLGDDVALVSIMVANNETGVVQPIRELAAAAHTAGALFHTDAIQGYLHIPLDVTELGVDAMSVAAHKIGGPVASGALYLKSRTPLRPRIFGGGQEAGRRAGTQDLRTQLAFAAAASSLTPHVAQERAKLQALSDKLYATLTAHPRIHATMGDYAQADRLPGMLSIYIDGMDSEELIIKLDAAGFEVSAGSACSSGSMDPSHVLSAMGIGREQALGALRISFDDRVNPDDLDEFAQTLLSIAGAA
ncbi:aminotransferase class V-fold PLP-dependent enzyme [Collinsella sp. AM43-1]|uniref:cysteine desulfurase family protein n=1 Tax=Collinsella sp. AM43-1 TaxID=2292322 RepID=UPI000E555B3D|nr:aminotransferase class V-fold PLP-dependent enzyme [Collinsella sp. AM43-1]RHA67077.1 aminotransferase class V-fold PLP-dependent enzyme [Collinsella sp. AM43-1]